jgi:hypothetical protein
LSDLIGLWLRECLLDEIDHLMFFHEAIVILIKPVKKHFKLIFSVVHRSFIRHVLLQLPHENQALLSIQKTILVIVMLIPKVINIDLNKPVIISQHLCQVEVLPFFVDRIFSSGIMLWPSKHFLDQNSHFWLL